MRSLTPCLQMIYVNHVYHRTSENAAIRVCSASPSCASGGPRHWINQVLACPPAGDIRESRISSRLQNCGLLVALVFLIAAGSAWERWKLLRGTRPIVLDESEFIPVSRVENGAHVNGDYRR